MTDDKAKKDKDEGTNIDFGLGGLFKGLTNLMDAATKLAEKAKSFPKAVRYALMAWIRSRGLKI